MATMLKTISGTPIDMKVLCHDDACVTLKSHMAKLINRIDFKCDGGCYWKAMPCYDCKCHAVAEGLLELADHKAISETMHGGYSCVEGNSEGVLETDLDLPKAMLELAQDWCVGNPDDEAPLWVRLAFQANELYQGEQCEQAFVKAFMLKFEHYDE
jgi:hypothetical protein